MLPNLTGHNPIPATRSISTARTIQWIALLCFFCGACQSTRPREQPHSQLQEGDIVFQNLPCGSLCDAIIATTPCVSGRRFNHCGLVHFENKTPYVIEAIGTRVQQTPLSDFMLRDSMQTLFAGRLKNTQGQNVNQATNRAMAFLGRPYDDAFLPGDSALYCSELIYECYRNPSGERVFTLEPMTFKARPNTDTEPAWVAYYKSLGATIPEGLPGINPCALASSEKLHFFSIKK